MRQQAAVVLGVILAVARARADDEVSGTRGTVLERRHEVDVVLHPGHARLTVRRTVENLGRRHDQALFRLEVPYEAAATGLRTLGSEDGRPRWFTGELMEAEAAARKYERLTGMGRAQPKDPALLSWGGQGSLLLQVFPVPPAERKTIEYTLTVPTVYVKGRHHLRLPRLGGPEVAPQVRVRAGTGDPLFVDGRPFPSGAAVDWAWLGHAAPDDPRDAGDGDEDEGEDEPAVAYFSREVDGPGFDLSLARRSAPLVDGRLAQLRIGPGRFLVRYRVETAPRLSAIPRHAQLVIVLDASRSFDDDQQGAALAAARAYLEAFGEADADVQIVTFARQALPLFPSFLSRARALERLETLALAPANGSNLDQALALADRLLAARPPGARRVLLLTDLLTRAALTPDRQRGALGRSGAVLHIGVVEAGDPSLAARDDPWSPVARATGGLVWDATASHEPARRPRMRRVFEEWVRPLRLHALAVEARALDGAAEHQPPQTLREGAEATFIGVTVASATPVEVRGELWSRPVRLSLRPDAAETRIWSALVFGTHVSEDLSDAEMMVLARHGRAVSPVTSYLAIEPGVRPSTEGLDHATGSVGGSGYGRGAGGLGAVRLGGKFDHKAWLTSAARDAWRACAGRGPVHIDIETTLIEIVEVGIQGGDRSEPLTCLREALWTLELPESFRDSWKQWSVSI